MAQSSDGYTLLTPRVAGSFTTPPSQAAPLPSTVLKVNPVVGADRFIVEGVSQSKPGFAYVLFTQPNTQQASTLKSQVRALPNAADQLLSVCMLCSP